jgi:hypothetical protein
MLWWWKSQLESPDGVTRQRAIEELAASLEHRSEDRQRNAAKLLATIGHPLAVTWSLKHVANRDRAESSVRLLEQIVINFPHAVENDSLEAITKVIDPLQKKPAFSATPGGRALPDSWECYCVVDCSQLRQKAEAELERRAKAEAEWRKADEEVKQQRKTALILVARRSA